MSEKTEKMLHEVSLAKGGFHTQEFPAADPAPKAPELKDSNPKDHQSMTRVPLWLLSPIAQAYWAMAQLAGLIKYGAWNWHKDGARASVYISAMRRHINKWEAGEEFDAIDGTRHLGNIMACAAILADCQAKGNLLDDRPPSFSEALQRAHEECEAVAKRLFEQYADRKPRHMTIADTEECSGLKEK